MGCCRLCVLYVLTVRQMRLRRPYAANTVCYPTTLRKNNFNVKARRVRAVGRLLLHCTMLMDSIRALITAVSVSFLLLKSRVIMDSFL